ncbi:VCBS repeat-containing protein [Fulvivirgaceae bacterium BMA12]|uniref:VCBS repeat-containing protein n=1 Tax=Agaribacillus aureus TaxID=3051825 RepID=A0ABT8L201_9BACT|nr:VCBS repeat-containing protein [Fulvivirgaceae bacterium BMA12]
MTRKCYDTGKRSATRCNDEEIVCYPSTINTPRHGVLYFNFLFTLFVIAVACKPVSETSELTHDFLFEKKMPEHTGIFFSNQVYESDTLNILKYEYFYNGGGVGVGDFNGDGWADLFFGGNMTPGALYLNQGDFTFKDITDQSGIDTKGMWATGVTVADVSGDGFLDIYISMGGYHPASGRANKLYINNGLEGRKEDNIPTFTEKAAEYGLDDTLNAMGAAFFDYDRDGDLDMYLLATEMKVSGKNTIRKRKTDGSSLTTDRLYRQEGVGSQRFTDISRQAGILVEGFGLGLAISDINRDGLPDIYVGNDYLTGDILYINNGDGTFTDRIDQYLKHQSFNTMGTDIADMNNDGLQDIIALDMAPDDHYRKQMMVGADRRYDRFKAEIAHGHAAQYMRNMFQINRGYIPGKGYIFSEIGQLSGIHQTDWSWSALAADFDNDGFRDIFITNGIQKDLTNKDFASYRRNVMENPSKTKEEHEVRIYQFLKELEGIKKHNFIFRNDGNMRFDDKTKDWGFGHETYSNGAAYVDLDGDGDLDLVTNNLSDPAGIYENLSIGRDKKNTANYLKIKLQGTAFNRQGIGAQIEVYSQGRKWFLEQHTFRGYRSSVDDVLHVGLGQVDEVDSLVIAWPDGNGQSIYNISANQLLTIKYPDAAAVTTLPISTDTARKLFNDVSGQYNLDYSHEEWEFSDFNIQPLLPHQYSKEGPGIAVGDVNGDGLDDFYIGGTNKHSGRLFLQDKKGNFTSRIIESIKEYEDMGALFFDADSDGDADLYLVSGGTGLPPNHPYYKDRLYINDGTGNFELDKNALPQLATCGSQVTAADYDRDGDLDLFVGGRIGIENFPLPPHSYLLRNDMQGKNARFTDVTAQASAELQNAGLVTGALWTDFDNDGWIDLLITGEWMPIMAFKNEKGQLINITESSGLQAYSGWWNSLTGADFDNDGDIDYVAGNLGLNTRLKVSFDQPMTIIAKDLDQNGAIDPVPFYYIQGENRTMHGRDMLVDQLVHLRKKFPKYGDFAKALPEDIFPDEQLKGAYIAKSCYAQSSYIENLGKGKFKIKALPLEAQLAPVFGLLTRDYNGDGHMDILLTGNSYSPEVNTGRYDALLGLLLKGDGQGEFLPVPTSESGFYADGDTKGMVDLHQANGKTLVLVGRNADTLLSFQTLLAGQRIIPGAGEYRAEVTYRDGSEKIFEFYYGNTYLSQSGRFAYVGDDAVSIKMMAYNGEVNERQLVE